MTLHVRLGVAGMPGRKVLAKVCISHVTLSIFALGDYEGIFLFFWGKVSSGYSLKKYTATKLIHKTIENKTDDDIQIRLLVFKNDNKVLPHLKIEILLMKIPIQQPTLVFRENVFNKF